MNDVLIATTLTFEVNVSRASMNYDLFTVPNQFQNVLAMTISRKRAH